MIRKVKCDRGLLYHSDGQTIFVEGTGTVSYSNSFWETEADVWSSHRDNGPYWISPRGEFYYRADNQFHREGGPSCYVVETGFVSYHIRGEAHSLAGFWKTAQGAI